MIPAFPLLVTALVACAPAEQPPEKIWQTTVLLKEKDLVVRLKVLAKASLAETGWMALEFENQGEKALTVSDAHYWIRAEYSRLGAGQPGGSGSLASGNTYDLFPHAWATTPISPIILPPGKPYRTVEQPSDYSSTLLGLPTPAGLSVRARIFLAINLADGRHLRVAEQRGIPFAFDWIYPEEAGFQALRARLAQLLRTPENRPHHGNILGTYLGIPQVARVATVDDLVAGLAGRRQPFEGRSAVVAHLAKHYANDPAVTAYYRQRLKDGDAVVLSDLHQKALWAPFHVQPLVGLYESDPAKYAEALPVLHMYRDDWIKDDAIVQRLSAVVQKAYPVVQQGAGRLKEGELNRWATAVENLSRTGDAAAIARLRLSLEDKRAFRSTKFLSMPADWRVPPLRVCDVALDAILTLLDGSPEAAYRQAGPVPVGRDNLDAAYADLRERMITALKERLAVRDKGK